VTPAERADFCSRAWGALSLAFHGAPAHETVDRIAGLARDARAQGELAIGSVLRAWPTDGPDESDEEVRRDFHALFLVPARTYVTPYESVFVDPPVDSAPSTSNFGPSTVAVQHFYRRVGLVVSPEYTELPDYIGLEFACMEYLCAEEAGYLRASDTRMAGVARAAQAEFIETHLARWAPALCDRIRERAATRFHRSLAEATVGLLRAGGRERVPGAA
jgi:TorA maturation chaperone TorD